MDIRPALIYETFAKPPLLPPAKGRTSVNHIALIFLYAKTVI